VTVTGDEKAVDAGKNIAAISARSFNTCHQSNPIPRTPRRFAKRAGDFGRIVLTPFAMR
jgi:hypothetical protein